MKVFRSTFVAAVALVAAACGDKVNVIGPDTSTPTPKVNSVTVSPATVVMAVGQTVSFTAVVDVSNGAAQTVTWSPTTGPVTVNASGVASATAATAGVAVCATSTADATKRGCAQVVVTAAPAATPPSIAISAVNFTNAAGQQQPAPVPPAGVAGQLNVVMNVSAGTAVLDSVVLRVAGKNAYKQTFTASQQAALAAAAVDPAFQSIPLTASFNTADYNTTTGAPTWQNGNNAIQAFVFGKNAVSAGGSPTNVQGNSPSSTYRFANPDGFHLNVTYTVAGAGVRTAGEQQIASAVDAAGFGWRAGAMNISALFVEFTPGTTPTIVTSTFNNLACSAGGVRTITLTKAAGTPNAGPYTGTFSNTATAGATNVTAYEMNPAICAAAAFTSGGEIPAIAAVGSDNNNIVLVGAGVNGGGGVLNTFANSLNPDPNIVVRLDNAGPAGVTWNAQSTNSANTGCAAGVAATSMGGRTNCWFNDAVVLNGFQTGFAGLPATSSQVSTNGLIATVAEVGSGRVVAGSHGLTATARVGLATDATATVDANAAVTSVAGLAETATNTAYRVRTRVTDILGNATNSGSTLAGSTTGSIFGVDRTPPGLAFVGGPAANARGVAPGGAYTFGATDNAVAPAAPSGFFNLAATPLTVTTTRREATIGTRFLCPSAPSYANTSTTVNNCPGNWPTGTTPTYLANLTVSDVGAPALLDAYFTISATVADQAGNVSPAASRVQVVDGTAPAIGGLSYPPFLTAGGSATFTSAIVDNLDIQLTRMNIQYGAIQPGAAGGFAASMIDGGTGAGWAAATTALGGSTLWYPDAAVNAYNASPLVTTATMSNTIANLYTQIQVTTASATGVVGAGALNAAGVANTANGIVLNQANTATASATPIIAGAIPAVTAIPGTGAAGAGPVNWFICGTTGTITAGTACPVIPAALAAANINVSRDGATAGQDQAVTFDAVATGATGVFNNPFSSVQFWGYDPTAGATEGWRLLGTVTNAATVTDGGAAAPNGRNWHYIFTWNPSATDAPTTAAAVMRVVAIGIGGPNLATASQRGVGLATPLGAITVTINP